jgi:hypothetical protein
MCTRATNRLRAHDQPPAELGAEAAAAEGLSHRNGELGRGRPSPGDRLELADRAQLAPDETAEDEGTGLAVETGAAGADALLARVAAEAEPPVLAVEAQEVCRQQPLALAGREPSEARDGGEGVGHRLVLKVGDGPDHRPARRAARARSRGAPPA